MARTATAARRADADTPPPAGGPSGFLVLLSSVIVLNLIGLLMVLSASSVTALYDYGSSWHFFIRQAVWVVVGLGLMALVLRIDYHRYRAVSLPLVGLSLVLLVLVLFVGLEVNGAQRWLGTDTLSLQPSEFAKLSLIIFTAELLARRSHRMHRTDITMRPVVVVLGLFAGLVMLQPNLGTTVLLAAIAFSMLFVAGSPLRALASVGAAIGLAGVVMAVAAPYRLARVQQVFDPWADPLGAGYQPIQAMISLASGGWFGRGLGQGRSKWEFLPEAHTDFIYAVIGEELGLVGALLVLVLFTAFAVFGLRTALRAPDRLGMLMATGVTAWISVQAFVNIGAVVGRLPITGVPLPFVSFGGSSMLVTMVAAGLLLNVARQAD